MDFHHISSGHAKVVTSYSAAWSETCQCKSYWFLGKIVAVLIPAESFLSAYFSETTEACGMADS